MCQGSLNVTRRELADAIFIKFFYEKIRKFLRQSGVHRRQAGGALADGELPAIRFTSGENARICVFFQLWTETASKILIKIALLFGCASSRLVTNDLTLMLNFER